MSLCSHVHKCAWDPWDTYTLQGSGLDYIPPYNCKCNWRTMCVLSEPLTTPRRSVCPADGQGGIKGFLWDSVWLALGHLNSMYSSTESSCLAVTMRKTDLLIIELSLMSGYAPHLCTAADSTQLVITAGFSENLTDTGDRQTDRKDSLAHHPSSATNSTGYWWYSMRKW